MYTHSHVGHARFGKLDGFELLAYEGTLRAFASPQGQETLSHALQLRQEEIRPYPGSEILSISMLEYAGHCYHLITLYRYALDRYKRDGYRAVTIALKNYWASPARIIKQLRELQKLDMNHPNPERVFQPGLSPQLSAECPKLRPGRSVFIPVGGEVETEMELLLAAWPTDLSVSYGRVYASASREVAQDLDPAHLIIQSHNPYSHVSQTSANAANSALSNADYISEIPSSSLVHAVAQDDEDRWNRKASPSASSKTKKKGQDGYWLWPGLIAVVLGLTGLVLWTL